MELESSPWLEKLDEMWQAGLLTQGHYMTWGCKRTHGQSDIYRRSHFLHSFCSKGNMTCSGSSPVDQTASQIWGKFWCIGNLDFIILCIYLFQGLNNYFLIKIFCMVISFGLSEGTGHCLPFLIHWNIQECILSLAMWQAIWEYRVCLIKENSLYVPNSTWKTEM